MFDHTLQIFQNLRQKKKKRKFFFFLGGMSFRSVRYHSEGGQLHPI